MADYDSSLPIRTEADGTDERVQTKVVDSTSPDSQQMEVDTDGNAHTEVHGDDPGGTDRTLRTSEQGHASVDGIYDGTNNTDPSNIAIIGHSRDGSPADTQATERVTTVEDSGGTVRSLDMSLHDEAGEAYTQDNPLPVSVEESEGTEVLDFQTSSAIAKDATVTHDYTVTASTTFIGRRVWVSGSGKLKAEIQLEDSPGAGTYTTQYVAFNSTSTPNIDVPLDRIVSQAAGAIVRVQITNRDNQAQDLYSTLTGIEK